ISDSKNRPLPSPPARLEKKFAPETPLAAKRPSEPVTLRNENRGSSERRPPKPASTPFSKPTKPPPFRPPSGRSPARHRASNLSPCDVLQNSPDPFQTRTGRKSHSGATPAVVFPWKPFPNGFPQ